MKNIFKALADFQQEVPVILKETKGYNYKYADLPRIFNIINPILKKNGLGFTQMIEGENIKTILFHVESGEFLESSTLIPFSSLIYENVEKQGKNNTTYKVSVLKGFEGMNKAQASGSLITYYRRYTLSTILGLITDKDTDGTVQKTIEKNTVSNTPQKPICDEENFNKLLGSKDLKIINNYISKVEFSKEQKEKITNHINSLKGIAQ